MNEKQIPDPEAIPQFSLSDYSLTDSCLLYTSDAADDLL